MKTETENKLYQDETLMKTKTEIDDGIIFVEVPHQRRAQAFAFGSRPEFIAWVEEISDSELEEPNPDLADRLEWIGRDLNHYEELSKSEALGFLEKEETRGHQAIEKLTEVRKAAIELGWIEPDED